MYQQSNDLKKLAIKSCIIFQSLLFVFVQLCDDDVVAVELHNCQLLPNDICTKLCQKQTCGNYSAQLVTQFSTVELVTPTSDMSYHVQFLWSQNVLVLLCCGNNNFTFQFGNIKIKV